MWRQKVHIGCKAGGQCKGLGSTFGGGRLVVQRAEAGQGISTPPSDPHAGPGSPCVTRRRSQQACVWVLVLSPAYRKEAQGHH